MKAEAHTLLSIADVSLSVTSLTLSYYTLTRCSLYNLAVKAISHFLSVERLDTLIYIAILGVALALIATTKEAYQKVYGLAWIIYLPALLSFSKLDWLTVLGFPINLENLTVSISPIEALIVGVVLVGGRTFLYFSSQLKALRSELLARGANIEEVNAAVRSAFVFTFALTALSTLIVLAAWAFLPLMETALKVCFTKAPHPYIIPSLIAVFITTLCVVIYLKTRSQP